MFYDRQLPIIDWWHRGSDLNYFQRKFRLSYINLSFFEFINKSHKNWEFKTDLKRLLAKKKSEIDWKFLRKYLFARYRDVVFSDLYSAPFKNDRSSKNIQLLH